MYTIDEKDEVIPWNEVPQSEPGAPSPVVFSDERATIVSYFGRDSINPLAEAFTFIKFHSCRAQMFGPPNDEAFNGHPLAARGLEPYGSFIVKNSSWIRQLERMNSVHRYHKPERFDELTHYILTFHDSTFECVAKSFSQKTVEYEREMPPILNQITNFLEQPDIPIELNKD